LQFRCAEPFPEHVVAHHSLSPSIGDDLRVIDERHRLLAESANDVIWTMSLAGEITYVSPSVEAMRGISPDEAMAQSLDEILTPESAAVSLGYFQDLYAALAEGREPPGNFRTELEYFCHDGSTVWCDVQVIPCFDDDGQLTEILGVSRDISERKRQQEALVAAREEAAAARVASERDRARKEERERMARDLHDDLLQTLAAVKGHLGMLDAGGEGDERSRKYLERSKEDLTRAIESARRLVRGHGPADLEQLGLGGALSALCDDTADRYGMAVEFMFAADRDRCPADVAEAVYRVAQEALNNAGRHSGAARVSLSVEDTPDGAISLRVSDDGRGMPVDGPGDGDGFGIHGMRQRLAVLGGALDVGQGSAGGTVVAARVPCEALVP